MTNLRSAPTGHGGSSPLHVVEAGDPRAAPFLFLHRLAGILA